jgi:hypothetical protein
MKKTWKLERTKQCENCPWKKSTDISTIPNYNKEMHKNLSNTIAIDLSIKNNVRVMSCHKHEAAHCIGWLVNQIGAGNNIGMRLQLMKCKNAKDIEVYGEQYQTFRETIERVES